MSSARAEHDAGVAQYPSSDASASSTTSQGGPTQAELPDSVDTNSGPFLLEYQEEKEGDDRIKLDMSSGSASVELGPVVVNEDGENPPSELRGAR